MRLAWSYIRLNNRNWLSVFWLFNYIICSLVYVVSQLQPNFRTTIMLVAGMVCAPFCPQVIQAACKFEVFSFERTAKLLASAL
jgi:hypothetical protein